MSDNKAERDSLVARAKQLGIPHHVNLGLDKLRILVNSQLDNIPEETTGTTAAPVETRAQYIGRKRKDALKLVRVIISCRNPEKTEWEGETFTASNSLIGSATKYVPFNNDEGWHVPQIVLNMIRERKTQVFSWAKSAQGARIKKGKQVNEFVITVLPDLTGEEIQELKERQAISQTIAD